MMTQNQRIVANKEMITVNQKQDHHFINFSKQKDKK